MPYTVKEIPQGFRRCRWSGILSRYQLFNDFNYLGAKSPTLCVGGVGGPYFADKIGMASFYVQKRSTVKTGWRLMKEEYQDGKKKQSAVPKIAWATLGFSDSMTLEQARDRARTLNKLNTIERREAQAVSKIAERVERDRLHHSAFVPEDQNQLFLKWLDDNVTGGEAHKERVRIHWTTAKKMIIKLRLTPEHYAGNKKQFYRYLAAQEYSLDYAKKLLRLVNMYGKFTARLTGRYFEEIPPPKGHDREMINDAYLDAPEYLGPSEALTPSLLQEVRESLKPDQYRWLHCSVWFGLRPSELDQLIEDRQRRYWRVEPGEVDVLWVYQPKLTSKPREKRWKPIPILFKEQMEALETIFQGSAQKPLTKTLKRHLDGNFTLYAGRKGFVDLMLDRGQRLEDIAQWMGHSSIQMTWTRYKDKGRVHFLKVIK